MSERHRPSRDQYETRSRYRWALKQWRKRQPGGSLWSVVLIAVVIGALSGSPLVLFLLVAFAVGGHVFIRQRGERP